MRPLQHQGGVAIRFGKIRNQTGSFAVGVGHEVWSLITRIEDNRIFKVRKSAMRITGRKGRGPQETMNGRTVES